MGVLEGLPAGFAATAVYALGLPGVVLIMWYVDNRRYERQEKKRDEDLNKVLAAYHEDVRTVTRFYEDNVMLVKSYEKLAADLASIIHLNTQAQTQLVEKIRNNMFCPIVREKGPAA